MLVLLIAATTKPATLGDSIASYAKAQIGKQVGGGECTDLVEAAMRSVKADRQRQDNPDKDDYVWGDLVLRVEPAGLKDGKFADIQPGDLVQFRDAKLIHREGRTTTTYTFEHHSAVIERATAGNIVILHQNYSGKRDVSELTLKLSDLKAGWMRIYRASKERTE
jgi:hypothetical protein